MVRKSYKSIAAELEKQILEDPGFELPTLVALANGRRVSYQTMWKAVRSLVDKGTIISVPGKKMVIAPSVHGGKNDDHLRSSTDRLFQTLRDRIAQGIYQVGKPFPKKDHFVYEEHLSPVTIARAFQRLAGDSLAHKQRSRWIVGPPPPRSAGSPDRQAPVVFAWTTGTSDWYWSFAIPYTANFMFPFRHELIEYRIGLLPALRDRDSEALFGVPSGLSEIKANVKRLRSRYFGTLLFSVIPQEEGLHQWVEELCSFGKPVVFFDSANVGGTLARRGSAVRQNYYRMHFDERAAVMTGLSELAAHGHRTIGVHGSEIKAWTERRTQIIRECAAGFSPPLRIVTAEPCEDSWNFSSMNDLAQARTHTAMKLIKPQEQAGETRANREDLLGRTASLAHMLLSHKPTALIGLNDLMAREYYIWLTALGLKVPDDISLVSFDNNPDSIFFPISTVDFGFSRLGYLAAHVFIDDITVQRDRRGNVAGPCRLIDRGSTGKAANPDRWIRKLRPGPRKWISR